MADLNLAFRAAYSLSPRLPLWYLGETGPFLINDLKALQSLLGVFSKPARSRRPTCAN